MNNNNKFIFLYFYIINSIKVVIIPCNVNSGPWVIDKNQPIRLAEFGARTQKYCGVLVRTTYSKDPDAARDNLKFIKIY